MSTTVTIQVDSRFETTVLRALAMAEEMEQLALTAADGTVIDVCEEAVIEKGRSLQTHMLGEAVRRRIDVAEKKGRLSGFASAGGRKPTAAPKNAS